MQGQLGSAVTSFVTEYRYASRPRAADFTIDVDHLKGDEIMNHLRELFQQYRRPSAPDQQELPSAEFDQMENQSRIARDTLQAAFGHRPDFDIESLKNFSDGAFDQIYSQLCRCAEQIEWPAGPEPGRWSSTANTVEECHDLAEDFMRNGLWPFTKIMR